MAHAERPAVPDAVAAEWKTLKPGDRRRRSRLPSGVVATQRLASVLWELGVCGHSARRAVRSPAVLEAMLDELLASACVGDAFLAEIAPGRRSR